MYFIRFLIILIVVLFGMVAPVAAANCGNISFNPPVPSVSQTLTITYANPDVTSNLIVKRSQFGVDHEVGSVPVTAGTTTTMTVGPLEAGSYYVQVDDALHIGDYCNRPMTVTTTGEGETGYGDYRIANACKMVDPSVKAVCEDCFNGRGVWSAIGCIPTEPTGLISGFLKLGMGIAGGIAFLLILISGLQIMTSAGNPERLNAGRELLAAAISGLLFIIFSVFILRFTGVTILGIPGMN